MTVHSQPILQTARLYLRGFDLADAPAVQALAGAPEIARSTSNVPHPYKDGMAEEWIGGHASAYDSLEQVTYAVLLSGSSTLIGAVGLTLTMEHRRGKLGYWLGVPYWNQGYMTEACREVVRFGFAAFGLHRIFAYHFTNNFASGNVMHKLGMMHEGTFREHVLKNGIYRDCECYGLLAGE